VTLKISRELTQLTKLHILCIALGCIGKWVLCKEFDDVDNPCLSKHILYRRKEQFNDGVGYSWIFDLKAHATNDASDMMMANVKYIYPKNTPTGKEAYTIR